MTSKAYAVFPVDPSRVPAPESASAPMALLGVLAIICLWIEILVVVVNLIFGGSQWLWGAGLILLLWAAALVSEKLGYAASFDARQRRAQEEAASLSQQFNALLGRAQEIRAEILPYFKNAASDALRSAQSDFSGNAIYPFWNHIQDASKALACYKDAVDQLTGIGELYSIGLAGRHHNFPQPFPIVLATDGILPVLKKYESTVKGALGGKQLDKVHQFTNIWLQMRTNEILIAGFATLEQAINEMSAAVLNALDEVRRVVQEEFQESHKLQRELFKTFESSRAALANQLTSMDTKLYYLQYRQSPLAQFRHRG